MSFAQKLTPVTKKNLISHIKTTLNESNLAYNENRENYSVLKDVLNTGFICQKSPNNQRTKKPHYETVVRNQLKNKYEIKDEIAKLDCYLQQRFCKFLYQNKF